MTVNLPQLLPVSELLPHPDNPRVELRDILIEGIANDIRARGEFRPEYSLIVRPWNGAYQIISGHHRHAAAQRAGISEVPCWVVDLSDREAMLELVRSNKQGELTPLEVGLHALKYVELQTPGRGNTGGLREYAEAAGKDHSTIVRYRKAALVYLQSQSEDGAALHHFSERTQHLNEISHAPEDLWGALTQEMLGRGWSQVQTKQAVDAALAMNQILQKEIPDELQGWLPPRKWCLSAAIEAGDTGQMYLPQQIKGTLDLVDKILEKLPIERPVWKFDRRHNPYQDICHPQQDFLKQLQSGYPNQSDVQRIFTEVVTQITEYDRAYQAWEDEQRSEQERQRLESEAMRMRLELEQRRSPVGMVRGQGSGHDSNPAHALIFRFDEEQDFSEDILHDYCNLSPTLHSEGSVILITPAVILCRQLVEVLLTGNPWNCENYDLWFWERGVDESPLSDRGIAQNMYTILVGRRNDAYYDASVPEEYRINRQSLHFREVAPLERLHWTEREIPIDFAEFLIRTYTPPQGIILEPRATCGTFSLAAKRHGREAAYITKDERSRDLIRDRLLSEPFPTELWLDKFSEAIA